MPYKVFLVEDEITTREGIRDGVDWHAAGFALCGEASDGEIALPQIEAAQPDVLITDIKMPFMDGLQLCKIVREHLPWMKIIIISGYSDFQYAQTAIQLGVSEYLLKPISVQDLRAVLAKVAVALDQETSERAYLKRLRSQVEENLALLREKFLLRLVTGGESSIAAIEQSRQLGLNIVAPYYQVIVFSAAPPAGAATPDYPTCQQVEQAIAGSIGANIDALFTRRAIDEFVMILKGDHLEQIEQESRFLAEVIRAEAGSRTGCQVLAGVGSAEQRLGDLHRSFAAALGAVRTARETDGGGAGPRLDHAALRGFLERGQMDAFDTFFDDALAPLVEASLRSGPLRRYVAVDIMLAVSQFISDLGGDAESVLPAGIVPAGIVPAGMFPAGEGEYLAALETLERARAETRTLFAAALAFRQHQAQTDRAASVRQAKAYIDARFADPELSLGEVAAQVNFSPNHFSAIFSEATGVTFRDYLVQARIAHARQLLRATRLKCAEVAYQSGYNDPHYFSITFRKHTGQTPQQFRAAARAEARQDRPVEDRNNPTG